MRLLRQAHEEQARHVLTERVVAADRIRVLGLRVEELERRIKQLEGEVTDAHRDAAKKVAEEHELATRHVEAARAECDTAVQQLEEFQQTRTYRLVLLMHRVLSRGPGTSR